MMKLVLSRQQAESSVPKSDQSQSGQGLNIVVAIATLAIFLLAAEGILRWLDLMDPPTFQTNPAYGYVMRPHQSASTRGYRFSINQAGFRGADFETHKPSDRLRIVFLGDSITYGGGSIVDEDLFVNRVSQLLSSMEGSAVESINIAMPAWGVRNMAGYVRTQGLHDADIVIWVISSADFRRPMTNLTESGFSETKSSSRLINGTSILLGRVMRVLTPRSGAGAETPLEALERNVEAMLTTIASIKSNGTSVVMVMVPSSKGYQPPEDLTKFRTAAESVSVPVIDVQPAFSSYRPELVFFDGVHLTKLGHDLVAKSITSFFSQQECRPRGDALMARGGKERVKGTSYAS